MYSALRKLLLNSSHISRQTFYWNAFSAVMNSFQTMVILVFITRFGSDRDSSIFVMAYAVGNLMLNVGKYGVRQFQVTDVSDIYSVHQYIKIRKITVAFMVMLSIIYLVINGNLYEYSIEKYVVIFLICLLKAIEAYEDVYHGRMQQQGRLDVAGRILGIRLCIFIVLYSLLFVVSRNIILTTCVCFGVSLAVSILFNRIAWGYFADVKKEKQESEWKLMKECFPLCVATCLNMYVVNAPKYTIDSVVSDEMQTGFNVVFMPVFVLALLGNFIFQPFLRKMGKTWNNMEYKDFKKLVYKLLVGITIISIVCIAIASWIGIPILEKIYKVQLNDLRLCFVLLLVCGGVIALQNLFVMIITTIRYQKYVSFVFGLVAIAMFFGGKYALIKWNIEGLCIYFLGQLVILLVLLVIISVFGINNAIKKKEI